MNAFDYCVHLSRNNGMATGAISEFRWSEQSKCEQCGFRVLEWRLGAKWECRRCHRIHDPLDGVPFTNMPEIVRAVAVYIHASLRAGELLANGGQTPYDYLRNIVGLSPEEAIDLEGAALPWMLDIARTRVAPD